MSNPSFQAQLAAMRQNYLNLLPEKISLINQIWLGCLASGLDKTQLAQMRTSVHNLAGSGATFGFSAISDVAENLEILFKVMLAQPTSISGVQQDQIQSNLIALDIALKQVAASHLNALAQVAQMKPDDLPLADSGKLVFLVDDDVEFAGQLSVHLARQGYTVCIYVSAHELKQALVTQRPAVIIMDMMLPQGEFAGAEIIRSLENEHLSPVPVIFVSVRKDFESRLQAVCAGATHYFVKPLAMEKLIQVLDEIVAEGKPIDAFRILVVDDDEALTNIYRLSLEGAGMQVVVVNDPMQALSQIKAFEPELILMDINMPACDGMELASIIRQFEEYNATPIIFLTTEWRTEKKLAAMSLGSDDFLTKPIMPWYLVASVKSRVKRARILKNVSIETQKSLRDLGNLKVGLNHHAIVSMTDVSGKIIYANEKFCNISGYSEAELLGQNHRIVKSSFHSKEFFDDLWQTISSGKVWQGEIKNRKKNGGSYWVAMTIVPFLDNLGVPQHYLSLRTDITYFKESHADFIANQSHTLRTPLNAILGFGQLLESDAAHPLSVMQKENMAQILKAAWHLSEKLNETLNKAQTDSANIEIVIKNNWLVGVVQEQHHEPE